MEALVEGNSIHASVRIAGAAKNIVIKLLCDIGQACSDCVDKDMRNLPGRRGGMARFGGRETSKRQNVETRKRRSDEGPTIADYRFRIADWRSGPIRAAIPTCAGRAGTQIDEDRTARFRSRL